MPNFIEMYFDYFTLVPGVLIIIGGGALIFLLIAIIAERRTRVLFPEHPKRQKEDGRLINFDFDWGEDEVEDEGDGYNDEA